MKLVTTYAALELLGPAYRWKTEAYLDGDDLVLKGYGDPKLNYESFWMLLRNLRARGVREIRGDMVLDRSYFAASPARADRRPGVPALQRRCPTRCSSISSRCASCSGPRTARCACSSSRTLPGLEVVNSLRSTDGACPEGRAFRELHRREFRVEAAARRVHRLLSACPAASAS